MQQPPKHLYPYVSYPIPSYPINYSMQTNPYNYTLMNQMRPFPPVDPSTFMKSAKQSSSLLQDAQRISERISNSHDFSKKLMEAAQQSKPDIVQNLLKSIALENQSQITYNPDGIRITLKSKNPQTNCCTLMLSLKWQEFL